MEMCGCELFEKEGDVILVSHISGNVAEGGDESADMEGEEEMLGIGSNEV